MDNASRGSLVDKDFSQVIPQGRVETRSKYGHAYVSYIESMTAAREPRLAIGGDELYRDPMTFRRDHYDETVCKIFDEALLGTPDTPALRPTHSHTHDFNLTYRGARLVDGECKLMAKREDKSVLVLHSADQLAYKDTALAMLTTNTCFQFFSSCKNIGRGKVITSICETKKYKLGSVTDFQWTVMKVQNGYTPLLLSSLQTMAKTLCSWRMTRTFLRSGPSRGQRSGVSFMLWFKHWTG